MNISAAVASDPDFWEYWDSYNLLQTTVYIQIVDWPTRFYDTHLTYNLFETNKQAFQDIVSKHSPTAIKDVQAESIADTLKYAVNHDFNVITSCMAGISRSGAISRTLERGYRYEWIGIYPPQPNSLVLERVGYAMGFNQDIEDFWRSVPEDHFGEYR